MNEFVRFLDEGVAAAAAEQHMLESSDRQDEANFARIKQNIYTIAKTVYGVYISKKGDSAAEDYDAQLSSMLSRWEKALELAEQYGKAEEAAAESVKIETMRAIKEKFRQEGMNDA